MTKEEEWEVLKEIHRREDVLLEQIWDIPELHEHFKTIRTQGRKYIRLGVIEEYLQQMSNHTKKDISALLTEHEQLEELRMSIVSQARHIAPTILHKIVNESQVDVSIQELEELAQAALLRAARILDPTRGLPYRTYARWWISAMCTRYIEHKEQGETWRPNDPSGRRIRLP